MYIHELNNNFTKEMAKSVRDNIDKEVTKVNELDTYKFSACNEEDEYDYFYLLEKTTNKNEDKHSELIFTTPEKLWIMLKYNKAFMEHLRLYSLEGKKNIQKAIELADGSLEKAIELYLIAENTIDCTDSEVIELSYKIQELMKNKIITLYLSMFIENTKDIVQEYYDNNAFVIIDKQDISNEIIIGREDTDKYYKALSFDNLIEASEVLNSNLIKDEDDLVDYIKNINKDYINVLKKIYKLYFERALEIS